MSTDYPIFNNFIDFYTRYELKNKYGDIIDFDKNIGEYTYSFDLTIDGFDKDCVLKIGRFCSIGTRCRINFFSNHNKNNVSLYPFYSNYNLSYKMDNNIRQQNFGYDKKSVIIGNDVWIGSDVTIMNGVNIGDGAIIGANSVVAKDIPAYSIAVGNPIEIKSMRFSPEQIADLLRIKWWEWPEEKVIENTSLLNNENIDEFIKKYKV